MNGVAIPFAYDMSLTYYENHVANISKGMMGGGNFYRMYHGVTQEEVNALGGDHQVLGGWKAHASSDNKLDISRFITEVYNGETPICLIDKVFREALNAVSDITGGALCGVAQLIFDIIDDITDFFGI